MASNGRIWRSDPSAYIALTLSALACVLVQGVLARSSRIGASGVSRRVIAADSTALAPDIQHRFRLGTASGSFTFSPATAIADFDTDGELDLAAVDRLGRTARGYRYAIEFQLTSAPGQTLVFGSQQDALGVAVADIDRDDDLDVVATPVVGDQILDIWLNDGTGRFREADLDEFPPVLPRSTGLTIRGPTLTGSDAVLASKGSIDFRFVAAPVNLRVDSRHRATFSVRIPCSTQESSVALRGPPAFRLLSI